MAFLILIRHGQSTYNLENRFTGNTDVELTPLGKEEAKRAGEKLTNFIFAIAYTSMLKRAQETLRIVLEEIKQSTVPIIKIAAFDERNYGNLQGLNKVETALKFGDKQVEIWRRSYNVCPPEGESLKDTYNRVVPYYKQKIEPELKAGETILVVAHGNSLRALMMYLENISPEAISEVNIATGSPRLYNFDNELKLISVNYL